MQELIFIGLTAGWRKSGGSRNLTMPGPKPSAISATKEGI